MTSFYRTKKIVLNQLNGIFDKASKDKQEIDLNALRLQIMLSYEVGELTINKMINTLGKYYGFKVVDDAVTWE